METAARFRAAVEARDHAAMSELFTEGVRLHSPVKFVPFEGKAEVLGLLGVLLRTFEDFRYVGALEGAAETGADGKEAPAHGLVFRAGIGGRQVHGIDLFQFDDEGRIDEMTVMVRPLSAVQALGAAVLAGLREDGLAP
ncbi:nuclear transport factor 2 family protein [Streptomyces subrutilus]|uniref:nuclear transport factor 2 family protein n=1 Tax=Streptomyces subrutilus TaxID=36818 RepID=UPI0033D3F2B0